MLPRRNILIFHSGALGDFVVTWPLAVALGRLHPHSRVMYIVQSQKGKLAERVLGVESRDVETGQWHRLFATDATLADASLRTLAGAQRVVSFVADSDGVWTNNVRRLAPFADLHILEPRPRERYTQHVTQFIADQLQQDRVLAASVGPILRSIADRGVGTTWRGGAGVVLHPGAGAIEKCWPVHHWIELCNRLKSNHITTRVLIGETELERWSVSVLQQFESAAQVVRTKDLLHLHVELSTADVFVGNDSGPGHVAGMIGAPTLTLMGGASDPVVWRPLGPKVDIEYAQSLETISVDQVYKRVRRVLDAKQTGPENDTAPEED